LIANGLLTGVDKLWNQYTNDNRIFTKDGRLNSARQSWSNYYINRARKALRDENTDSSNITPEQARAELARRQTSNEPK
jgi:hypothetical protein